MCGEGIMSEPNLEITHQLDPDNIWLPSSGKKPSESKISLTLKGRGTPEKTPIDAVLAIDSSGSMGTNDPNNYRLKAAETFVKMMDLSEDKVGLVSWDDHIDFELPLTNELGAIIDKIHEVDSSGGTNLDLGLETAITLLSGNPNTSKIIIFLSDGDGTYTPSGKEGSQADRARAEGITIYSIGLAVGGSPVVGSLRDMAATTGGKYFDASESGALELIYKEIGNSVKNVVARDVIVYYTIPFELNGDKFTIKPWKTDYPTEKKPWGKTWSRFCWNVGTMSLDDSWDVSFNVSSDKAGVFDLGMGSLSRVIYMRSGEAHFIEITEKNLNVKECKCDLRELLKLYYKLDLYGTRYPIFPGAFANLYISIYGGVFGSIYGGIFSDFDWIIGEVDGKKIKLKRSIFGINCNEYQVAILKWLNAIRSSERHKHLLDGCDYGPFVVLPGYHEIRFHRAVVIYPSGTDWRDTGTVLDPWVLQEAKAFDINEYKKRVFNWILPDNIPYEGEYPMTGGTDYPKVTKIKIEEDPLKDRIQIIVDCSVNILITNQRGERIGKSKNGNKINEMSDGLFLAYPVIDDNLYWYFILSPNDKYEAEISGIGEGEFNLLIGQPSIGTIQDYGNRPLSKNERARITLDPSSPIAPLILPNGTEIVPLQMKLIYLDDFSDDKSGWKISSDDYQTHLYQQGKFHITLNKKKSTVWNKAGKQFSDFVLEVEASLEEGQDEDVAYGVLLRYQDKNNYYRFKLSGNGKYGFDKKENDKWFTLINWTKSSAVTPGKSTNMIKAVCNKNMFIFYVNGVELGNFKDSSFDLGDIALCVSAYNKGYVHASFDNLKVWALNQAEIEQPAHLDVEITNDVYTEKDPRIYCKQEGGRTYYKDRIYLTGSDLKMVKNVKYILHETFGGCEPVATDPTNNFDIWIWTYGGFLIKAIITDKNEQVFEKRYQFSLKSKVEEALKKGIPIIKI
jgi:uncharacterized protein YhbP (UPF0306 family)